MLSNYITYGIRYGPMYDYKDHVYKDDIFRYSSLPAHLKGKRVIFTQDVMALEEYERTPYGIHMAAEDLYYQAVLFFYQGERVIGSMGLFRTREEGGFAEAEREPLEYLAQLVEANYQTYLRHSGEARFQDCFHLFFQEAKMGAVILNQDMTVLQTNQAAQEISRIFWEQYRHNQGHFLRSNYQGDPKFREVQTMINEISERLTAQGGTSQTFTSLAGDISFYHTSFLSSSAGGLIQTWHLMFIACQTKELPKNLNHPYNTLTPAGAADRLLPLLRDEERADRRGAPHQHLHRAHPHRQHLQEVRGEQQGGPADAPAAHPQGAGERPPVKNQPPRTPLGARRFCAALWSARKPRRRGASQSSCIPRKSGLPLFLVLCPQAIALPPGHHQVLPVSRARAPGPPAGAGPAPGPGPGARRRRGR